MSPPRCSSLGISAYYLLKGRDLGFARRSFAIASGFGLASILSVIVLGDESGYEVGDVQQTKLAAIEAEWETEEPPAAFTLFGLPDNEAQETHGAVKIPFLMGLIATRSLDEEVLGLKDLEAYHEKRIRPGCWRIDELEAIRQGTASEEDRAMFDMYKKDLGYGLLLKRYTEKVVDATDEQIKLAARDTIPEVAPLFWSFRVMVAAGFWMLLLFVAGFYLNARRRIEQNPWLLRAFLWSIPVPWIAAETGWFVAEFGRQPWAIGEVLPTFMATSSLTATDLWTSLTMFIIFYTGLAVIEMYLMFKFGRLGPSSLHTGRYHFETTQEVSGGSATLVTSPAGPRGE